MDQREPSFDEIAVALALAASKVRLDLDQLEILAARVSLSPMGTSLAIAELKRVLDHVAYAHRFFKDNAGAEAEIRAAALRKKRGSWLSSITRVAAL